MKQIVYLRDLLQFGSLFRELFTTVDTGCQDKLEAEVSALIALLEEICSVSNQSLNVTFRRITIVINYMNTSL